MNRLRPEAVNTPLERHLNLFSELLPANMTLHLTRRGGEYKVSFLFREKPYQVRAGSLEAALDQSFQLIKSLLTTDGPL